MANLRAPAALVASLIISGFLFLVVPLTGAMAEETAGTEVTVWERFAAYDADSDVVINHSPLTGMLEGTVIPLGRAKSRLGPQGKSSTYMRSHIKFGNNSPSRFEGNRLMIHAFTDDHDAFFAAYQEGLEWLSERRPLATFNRNEQLAYWLNLYNVIVINKLIEEYPISKLKTLRLGGRGEESFWRQKVTMVEGVPLSLNDIEQILYHNWDSPLVIYGLFQGSIGGPNLLTQAYTSENVWKLLDKNAVEFVNSNRGVRPQGNTAKVSLFYEWNKAAFGGSDQAVLEHIQGYADPSFMGDISDINSLKYKYYDWYIADLIEGNLHAGETTNAAAVMQGASSVFRDTVESHSSVGTLTLPPQALRLLAGAMRVKDMPRRTPLITSEECAPDDPCGAENNSEQ